VLSMVTGGARVIRFQATKPDGGQVLASLQILRGLAALGILAVHLSMVTDHVLHLRAYLPRLTLGEAGVDLFFVISGFIMVHASADAFGRPHAPLSFFARRVVRIVPLYWAVSTWILAAFLLGRTDLATLDLSWGAIVASFLFVPYARPSGLVWPMLQVGWTLNFEMFFYLVFAIALMLRRRSAIIGISLLFVVLIAIRFAGDQWPVWFEFLSRPIILEFCLGMILALGFARGYRIRPASAAVVIVAACTGLLATNHFQVGEWRVIVWGVPAAAIVASVLSFEGKAASSAIGRAFALLGDASYSLYLVHLPVMLAASRLLPRLFDTTAAPWLSIALMAALPLVAAFATYFGLERPVTRWLQRRVRVARTAPQPTLPQPA
jgi:exopolysaccharide production protein ExoZ